MANSRRYTWIGGTVFAALVMVVGAWFLAINPMLSSAADLRKQTDQVQQHNQVLNAQLTKLKADFAKLPEYKDQLTALRAQIPSDADLSAYLLQIDAIATAHGLTITALTPGAPEAFVAAAPAATPSPTPTPGATSSAAAPKPANAAGASGGAPDGFYDIPMSITVVGGYDATQSFLSDLQNSTPRLFLVTAVAGTAQKQADASGGKPATAVGDEQLVITGMMYVLSSSYPAATPAATTTPAPLPSAVPGKNPLKPVAGK